MNTLREKASSRPNTSAILAIGGLTTAVEGEGPSTNISHTPRHREKIEKIEKMTPGSFCLPKSTPCTTDTVDTRECEENELVAYTAKSEVDWESKETAKAIRNILDFTPSASRLIDGD
jgi:hypothetical protein